MTFSLALYAYARVLAAGIRDRVMGRWFDLAAKFCQQSCLGAFAHRNSGLGSVFAAAADLVAPWRPENLAGAQAHNHRLLVKPRLVDQTGTYLLVLDRGIPPKRAHF
jgi:hypothetical protein